MYNDNILNGGKSMITEIQPFLLRFKMECISPNRVTHDHEFFYDPELSLVMTIENGEKIPAIESKSNYGPTTKKMDIEKGEDQKDSRMWGH